jgi:retron-type reverse transcriptase
MQLELFSVDSDSGPYKVDAAELFEAYFQCRRTKRNKSSALAFEVDYEEKLYELRSRLESGNWKPSPSLAFIVRRPVRREIFAADFGDRVVHHWLMNKLNPLLEKYFLDSSFACRVNRGTHYGIAEIYGHMHPGDIPQYNPQLHVLKLDISGFFMSINRKILFHRISQWMFGHYRGGDLPLVSEVLFKVIFNDAASHCIRRGRRRDWKGLPRNKSLFNSAPDCGLPIGNLTSQILANFYLHPLDEFVRNQLGVQRYGRYVDDFVLMHENPQFLIHAIGQIREFLRKDLGLELHPHKIYLQHSGHGLPFLGMFIKPGRIYAGRRIKSNLYKAISRFNVEIRAGRPDLAHRYAFRQSINSYLGMLKHYQTFRLRKNFLMSTLSVYWLNHFGIRGGYAMVVPLVRPAKFLRANGL